MIMGMDIIRYKKELLKIAGQKMCIKDYCLYGLVVGGCLCMGLTMLIKGHAGIMVLDVFIPLTTCQ